MKHHIRWTVAYGALLCTLSVGLTGSDAATQADQADPVVPASIVTTRSVKAVGYQVGGGSTKVDMKTKAGRTKVDVTLKEMTPPSQLGAEFLTYVLWVVTPEGRTGNTGELLTNKNGDGKLSATTPAQTFSLLVTA